VGGGGRRAQQALVLGDQASLQAHVGIQPPEALGQPVHGGGAASVQQAGFRQQKRPRAAGADDRAAFPLLAQPFAQWLMLLQELREAVPPPVIERRNADDVIDLCTDGVGDDGELGAGDDGPAFLRYHAPRKFLTRIGLRAVQLVRQLQYGRSAAHRRQGAIGHDQQGDCGHEGISTGCEEVRLDWQELHSKWHRLPFVTWRYGNTIVRDSISEQ
ncbi:conserved hypothetical protein, partial [Ricinus communis]